MTRMTRPAPPARLPALLFALLMAVPLGSLPVAGQDVPPVPPEAPGTPPGTPDAGAADPFPPYPGLPPPPATPVLVANELGRDAHREGNALGSSTWALIGDQAALAAAESERAGALRIFQEGVGDDGRFGGFGDWQVLGTPDWAVAPGGTDGGRSTFALARPDGGYPGGRRSMLLSPELDLRSGLNEHAATELYNEERPDRTADDLIQQVWTAGRDAVNGVWGGIADTINGLNVIRVDDTLGDERHPGELPNQTIESDSSQGLYKFAFDLRTNLQDGADGLQIWAFSERPEAMPTECKGTCTVVMPGDGYDGSVRSMPGAAFTGHHDWMRVEVDIVGDAGRSVWFGFAFASASCPAGCVQSSSFDRTAGFFGAEVDNLEALIQAPPRSVRMRPFAEPSIVPEGRQDVTVPPDARVPVRVEVANLGRSDHAFDVRVTLRNATSQVGAPVVRGVTLPSGWTGFVAFDLDPLPVGDYTFQAAIENLRSSAPGAPPVADPGGASLDADPSDNQAPPLHFRVERIAGFRFLELAASATQVGRGDPLEYVAAFSNRGNVPLNVTLTPRLLDVTDNVTLGVPAKLANDRIDAAPVILPLAVGGAPQLVKWKVATAAEGQVQLEVSADGPALGPATLRGPAIGIDRTPPPLFYHGEAAEGPRGTFLGEDWERSGALGDQGWRNGADYWIDPAAVHYVGRPAGLTCAGTPVDLEGCRPYATLRDPAATATAHVPSSAELRTPPIFVPAGAADPYLVFEHQLATASVITDCNPQESTCPNANWNLQVWGNAFLEGRTGSIDNLGNVVWDHAEDNGGWIQLGSETTPIMRGENGERVLGMHDPLAAAPRVHNPDLPYCSSDDPGDRCQWWWPSGETDAYRAPGEGYPSRHRFEGSPWLLEKVPLVSEAQGDPQVDELRPFDARGRLFQARFLFPHAGDVGELRLALMRQPSNVGWRLGTVAVLPTLDLQQDLRVEAIRPSTPYDADALGLGPGTEVDFQVQLFNAGLLDLASAQVQLEYAVNGTWVAAGSTTTDEVKSGARANVTVAWTVPAADSVRVRARVADGAGLSEDFPGDNLVYSPRPYAIRPVQNAAVIADVTPRGGTLETLRILSLAVENRGNMPLDPDTVLLTRSLERITGVGGVQTLGTATWRILGPLAPGERADLSDPDVEVAGLDGSEPDLAGELRFQPRLAGAYRQQARIALATGLDADPSDDAVAVPFTVAATLYSDPFDKPAKRDPQVVSGQVSAGDGWATADNGVEGSQRRLLAGDEESGELPLGADTSYTLPPLDLTAVKRATLTFQHRYSLEEGFDAARVEVSVDGGRTWEPLRPRADPTHGLPDGYSSAPLLTDLPLADGEVLPTGAAYTGSSDLLRGVQEGDWLTAEFDLGSVRGLQEDVVIDAFPMEDLASKASLATTGAVAVRDGPSDPNGTVPLQFTDPSWRLPEEGAAAGERYWWIDNQTLRPAPRTQSMWWSGSQGTGRGPVDTTLAFPAAPASATLTWWDWRDGWRDGDRLDYNGIGYNGIPYDASEPLQRDGSGGRFLVELGGTDVSAQATILQRRDDGWTQRSLVLPSAGALAFHYVGDQQDVGNRGWFVDDVRVGGAPFQPSGHSRRTGADPGTGIRYQDVNWTCIGAGAGLGRPCAPPAAAPSRRDGGWHVEDGRPLPDGTLGKSWRFSDPDSPGGYPAGASARLVTPVVDLSRVSGSEAWLRFDHRYDLHATAGCIVLRNTPSVDSCDEDPPHQPPLVAHDAAVVEVQVFDETTGRFGPWQVLTQGPPADVVQFNLGGGAEALWTMGAGAPDGQMPLSYAAMGYNAIQVPLHGSDLVHMEHELVRARAEGNGLPDPLSFTPAFSGTQDGWTEARFGLADLLGRKVRFAFHAWTDANQPGIDPRDGWEVAGIAVLGTAFQGKDALLRLRANTDESRSKGEWSVDSLELSGDLYRKHLVVVPDERVVRARPGEPVVVTGNISNLAVEARRGIALRVSVTDESGNTVEAPLSQPVLPLVEEGMHGITGARGPMDFTPGQSRPFRVLVPLPDGAEQSYRVHFRLFEDRGPTTFPPGQAPVHTPDYRDPLDEVPGSGQATVEIVARTITEVLFEPPSDSGSLVEVAPFVGHAGEPVALAVAVRNNGTTTVTFPVTWTLTDRDIGGEDTLRNTTTLAPGQRAVLRQAWEPEAAGLYRLTVILGVGGSPALVQDIPVDRSLQAFTADFSDREAWDLDLDPGTGAESANNRWNLTGASLRWGVPEEEFGPTNHYCSDNGTALCAPNQSTGEARGLSATAATAPFDLTRPAGEQARLLLTHRWSFAAGDGGVVEATVFRDPSGEEPLCTDAQGNLVWVRLTPEGGYPGSAHSDDRNVNPVGRGPAFAGRSPGSDPVTSIFDLATQDLLSQPGLSAGCRQALQDGGLFGGQDTSFVSLRFHAGTRTEETGRRGDRGWAIESASVGSSVLRLAPRDPPDLQGFERILPVLDGQPKRFLTLVANDGPVGDFATLELAPDGTAPPAWFSMAAPPAALAPGTSRAVAFRVDVPPEDNAARTVYAAPLVARSGNAPATTDRLLAGLQLKENLLPDLHVRLRLDGVADVTEVPAGSPVTLTAIVSNLGRLASEPVKVRFAAQAVGGAPDVLGEAELPALQPATGGRGGSFAARSMEWITPERPGPVDLLVEVDPVGRLLEQQRGNNVVELQVDVVGSDAPDLAVTDLRIGGLSGDGFAEAGSFVTLNATVSNLGRTPAQDVRIQVLLGSSVVTEELVRQMAPGQNVTVSTIKVAPAGEFVLRALALSNSVKADPNPDNDQATRVLRVRGHRLAVEVPAEAPVAEPGGRASTALRLSNLANAPDRLRLELADAARKAGWTLETFPDPVIALPGSVARAFLVIGVPANASAGPQALPLRAVPVTAPALAVPFNVTVQVASLDPAVRVSGTGHARGDTVALDLVLRNLGNAPRTLNVAVAGDGNATPVVLAGFEAQPVRITHRLDAAPEVGRLSVPVLVFDAGGTVASVSIPVDVEGVPIVKAWWTDVRVAAQPAGGRVPVEFSLGLANLGNQGVRLRPVASGLGVPLDLAAMDLAAGDSATVTFTLDLPDPLPEALGGLVRIVRDEDRATTLAEAALPALPPRPNLQVSGWEVDGDRARAGDKVGLSLTLNNTGGAAAPASLVLVYVDRTLVQTLRAPALAPGESVGLSTSVKVPQGTHALIVLADGGAAVSELRKDDNGASSILSVQAASMSVPGLDGLAVLAALAVALALARRRSR